MSEKDFNYVSAADEHSDNIARVKWNHCFFTPVSQLQWVMLS